ncbi:MAG: hypothetical protein LBT83_02985 [Tannerella sp.]|nr:hypothetical protein [Tannerella sp.]
MGTAIQAGVDLLNFSLDARFERSLSDVYNGTGKMGNRMFVLTLGFFVF